MESKADEDFLRYAGVVTSNRAGSRAVNQAVDSTLNGMPGGQQYEVKDGTVTSNLVPVSNQGLAGAIDQSMSPAQFSGWNQLMNFNGGANGDTSGEDGTSGVGNDGSGSAAAAAAAAAEGDAGTGSDGVGANDGSSGVAWARGGYIPHYASRYAQGGPVRYPMKAAAEKMASKGRFGDSVLVHMNPKEVQELARMAPGGKLTINPDTGQPEAFLPFLAPLLGGVLGSWGAGALGVSSVLGGALGSGLASWAESGNLGKGVASGLLSFGLGSALQGLGDLAGGAAGAAGAGAGETGAQGLGALAADVSKEGATELATNSLGAGATSGASAGGWGTGTSLVGGMGVGDPTGLSNSQVASAPGMFEGQFNVGTGALKDQYSRAATGLMNDPMGAGGVLMENAMPIGLGLAGMYMDEGGSSSGPPLQEQTYGKATTEGTGRKYKFSPADPYGREQTYFTPTEYKYADGGKVNRPSLSPEGRISTWTAERLAREYDDRRRNEGPIGDLESPSPFNPRSRTGRYASGGGVSGPGGGLDDAIPAIINGRKPAAISSGEYIIPAHAVSALGNGSTEEGVRQLDGMVDNTMMAKYGSNNRKPRPVNPGKLLPA